MPVVPRWIPLFSTLLLFLQPAHIHTHTHTHTHAGREGVEAGGTAAAAPDSKSDPSFADVLTDSTRYQGGRRGRKRKAGRKKKKRRRRKGTLASAGCACVTATTTNSSSSILVFFFSVSNMYHQPLQDYHNG